MKQFICLFILIFSLLNTNLFAKENIMIMKLKANNLDELSAICAAIEKAGNPYDYVIIDTITKLEEMVLPSS